MKLEIKVPSVGESVNSAEISEWLKKPGDFVKKGEILVVLETDKASMDLPAEQSGKLEILKASGEVLVDEKIGSIDSQSWRFCSSSGSAQILLPSSRIPFSNDTATNRSFKVRSSAGSFSKILTIGV